MNQSNINFNKKYQIISDQEITAKYAVLIGVVNRRDFEEEELDNLILEMDAVVEIMKARKLSFTKAYADKKTGLADSEMKINALNKKLSESWNRMVNQGLVGIGVGVIPILIALWFLVVSGSAASLTLLFILGIVPFLLGLGLLTFSYSERTKLQKEMH